MDVGDDNRGRSCQGRGQGGHHDKSLRYRQQPATNVEPGEDTRDSGGRENEGMVWKWGEGLARSDLCHRERTYRTFCSYHPPAPGNEQAARCFHYRLATAVVPGCAQSPPFLAATSQPGVAHAVAQCDSTAGDVLMRNVSLAVWARLLAHHECRPSCSRAETEGAEARIKVLLQSWARPT